MPFFNLYDDIQITQLGSTGLATTLGAAGIAQVPAFSRACRGRRPRRGTQHDPGAPRRHRRGDRVSPGVIHVTAPRRRSGAGSRGGEGLVAPTTRSSRRHTPGQVTPNDTSGRHSGRFPPFFAPGTVPCNPSELCQITCPIRADPPMGDSPEAARTAALPISVFCPVFSGAFTVRFVTFSPSSGGHCSSPTRRSCAVFSRELGWMARRGDPRGPSNAHVRVHVGGALVPRSAKWGRLVRRFWPVFGTLEYAAGTMDAGWPPNSGEHSSGSYST